jgi:DNA-binding response OmpR family regulator/anti-anti-sigma regulatory factor
VVPSLKQAEGRPVVLVVDDDAAVLEQLYGVLSSEQLDVIIANDGKMMMEVVSGELPDLVLLDVVMPGIDGFEACQRLKASPAARDVPVIFMTSLTETEYKLKAFRAGAVDYINKPIETAELLARVRTHLSLRSLTKSLKEQNALQDKQLRALITAEAEREKLTQALLLRTEELRKAKERLEMELAERERAEAARAALQEQVLAAQREKVVELSSPLIPITDWLVVIPLIGTMDIERAQRAMVVALRGAAERRARVVILDITGIRALDADVANMLVKTGDGLRVLGAQAVITGIAPAVAQTLVKLDISLGTLVTMATLQDGIAYAMQASASNHWSVGNARTFAPDKRDHRYT